VAWRPWLAAVLVLGAGCACVCGYLYVKNIALPAYRLSQRLARAEAMFQERCKRAGVVIHRTVQDVEEIRLINVRTEWHTVGQFALWDPYGHDDVGEGYIASFLQRPARETGGLPKGREPRYRAVHAEFPDPGVMRRFRYMAQAQALDEIQTYGDRSYSKQFVTNGQMLAGERVCGPGPRYGLRFKDLSTREDRDYWIAGSSLQVVDLERDEVIAERIGYLWDPGQGDRAGGRTPWAVAARDACPPFTPLPGMPPWEGGESVQPGQAFRFAAQVLIPKPQE
jgi:hypothetical protein